MPVDLFSKSEILAVLKSLLDRGEDKIPVAVVREALAPFRSAILQSIPETSPNMDQLEQILRQAKEQSLPTTEPLPPAENPPESLP